MTMTSRSRAASAALALALALLPVSALSLSHAAFASNPGEEGKKGGGEEKTEHYKVPLPETKDGALKLLNDNIAIIEKGLAAGDFEAIHQATYSVEAALARIAKEPGYDGITVTVAPRCEIVHLASEQRDAETLKAAVPILAKAVKDQGMLASAAK
jgi:hypothetical protein